MRNYRILNIGNPEDFTKAASTVATDTTTSTTTGDIGISGSPTAYGLTYWVDTTTLGSMGTGATTQLLVGGGTSAVPVWTTATGSGSPVRGTSPTIVTPTIAKLANLTSNGPVYTSGGDGTLNTGTTTGTGTVYALQTAPAFAGAVTGSGSLDVEGFAAFGPDAGAIGALSVLHLGKYFTETSTARNGVNVDVRLNPSSAASTTVRGGNFTATNQGAGFTTSGNLQAVRGVTSLETAVTNATANLFGGNFGTFVGGLSAANAASISGAAKGFFAEAVNNSTFAGTAASAIVAVDVSARTASTSTSATQYAINASSENTSSGTVTAAWGANLTLKNTSTGTMGSSANHIIETTFTNNGGGTLGPAANFHAQRPVGGSGSTNNWGVIYGVEIGDMNPSGSANTLSTPPIGLYLDAQTATGAYAIKNLGGLNVHAGMSRFGASTDPTEVVHVSAGNIRVEGGSSTGYIDIGEYATTSDPSAPSDNRGRLYVRDNGAGKEQLCVRFNTGAVQVLATEP
jgi:hypothetical protein